MSSNGEGSTNKVAAYDFRRPKRIRGALLDRIGESQRRAAQGLARTLSDETNVECALTLKLVVEETAGKLLADPEDAVFVILSGGATGDSYVKFPSALGQAFVDGMLGGEGSLREISRAPTTVEVELLGRVAERIERELSSGREGDTSIERHVRHVCGEAKGRLSEERGVMVEFGVEVGGEGTSLAVLYSYEMTLDLLGMSEGGGEVSGEDTDEDDGAKEQLLSGVRLPLKVRFTPTAVHLRDILGLRVGDVLHLDRRTEDEVEILIGHSLAFYGHPGALDGALGVRISRRRD